MTAPAPSVCPACQGDRVILVGLDALRQWERPCPGCCCEVCGQPTDTPPECAACAAREEASAKRRADR